MPGDRLPADALADRFIAVYLRAERRLNALLVAAITRGSMGSADYYFRQLRIVDQILAGLRKQTVPLSLILVRGAYTNGVQITDRGLSVPTPFSLAGRHDSAAVHLSSRLLASSLAATETVGRSMRDAFAQIARDEVSAGIAAGLGRREISAAMKRELLQRGLTGFVDRRGRRWRLEPYTRMVARTTTREAVTVGTINRMMELGADLVTVSSHVDSCDICKPHDGKTYSLTGRTPGYPEMDFTVPIHPNCRHVLTPGPVLDAALGNVGIPVAA